MFDHNRLRLPSLSGACRFPSKSDVRRSGKGCPRVVVPVVVAAVAAVAEPQAPQTVDDQAWMKRSCLQFHLILEIVRSRFLWSLVLQLSNVMILLKLTVLGLRISGTLVAVQLEVSNERRDAWRMRPRRRVVCKMSWQPKRNQGCLLCLTFLQERAR